MMGSRELLPPISLETRCRGLFSHVVFEGAESVVGLDVAHLLDADGGRADAADANDSGVVVQFFGGEDVDGGVASEGLAGAEHAYVGVAAAAGAEDAGADGDGFQVGFSQTPHWSGGWRRKTYEMGVG